MTVTDRPPTASFTVPATVGARRAVSLDASTSSDPDGAVASYRWDFGDRQTQTTTDPIASHVYGSSGTKTVTLTVTDDSGSTARTNHVIRVLRTGRCVVPRLVGKKLAKARKLLRGRNCRLGASTADTPGRARRGV